MGAVTRLAAAIVACALAASARADHLLTRKTHVDAFTVQGKEVPARDGVQTLWIGKDRLRIEEGDRITIVRLDRAKVWLLDSKARTYNELDVPIDLAKHVPAEGAALYEKMAGDVKALVTPTDETKKIGEWTARRYAVAIEIPMEQGWTSNVWATKDLPVDAEALRTMSRALAGAQVGGDKIAAEMGKIDGVTVRLERTRKIAGTEVRQTEELASIEAKDPPTGIYDLPAGWTAKPYNPLEGAMRLAKAAAEQAATEKKAPPK
jgi:hypothetical protein